MITRIKLLCVTLLLLTPIISHAQGNYLRNLIGKSDPNLVGEITDEVTQIDSAYMNSHIFTHLLDIRDAILSGRSYSALDYASLAAAMTAMRNAGGNPLIIPGGYVGSPVTMAAGDSSLFILDYRYGKETRYGLARWAFNSVTEADSLNRLKKIIDSTRAYGKVNLGEGTWTTASPIVLSSGMRIEGTTHSRVRDALDNLHGTVIKSTSTTKRDTIGVVEIKFQGVNLANLSVHGNGNLNSNGFYGYRSISPAAVTLGGYSIVNSTAYDNGKNGYSFEGSDGNYFYNLESYRNGASGMRFSTPEGNGKTSAGAAARGTTNVVISGRMRKNGYYGYADYETNATTFIGAQSITDTTGNVYTFGTNRTTHINGDYEFAAPPRVFTGASPRCWNLRSRQDRAYTMIGTYFGSTLTQASDYTMTGSSTATTIVDPELPQMPNDYYIGYKATNITEGSSAILVTDYDRTSNTLTIASPIAGNSNGDVYSLTRNANIGFFADSLLSGVFINNNFSTATDTVWATKTFAYPLFIGASQNFDPETDIKNLSGATTKWASIALDKIATGGDFRIYGGTKTILRTVSDSLVIRGGDGVRLESPSDPIDIQPNPGSDTGTQGDVHIWSAITNEVRPELRLYGDVNVSAATLAKKYIVFKPSAGQNNLYLIGSQEDSLGVGFSTWASLTGNDQTSRYMDIQASTNLPSNFALLNNRVRLYAYEDKLYAHDDAGDTLNIVPYNYTATWNPGNLTSGSVDSVDVSVTNADLGDAIAVGHTGITGANANIQLWAHCIANGSVRVYARNNSGGTYDIPSGVLRVRTWR